MIRPTQTPQIHQTCTCVHVHVHVHWPQTITILNTYIVYSQHWKLAGSKWPPGVRLFTLVIPHWVIRLSGSIPKAVKICLAVGDCIALLLILYVKQHTYRNAMHMYPPLTPKQKQQQNNKGLNLRFYVCTVNRTQMAKCLKSDTIAKLIAKVIRLGTSLYHVNPRVLVTSFFAFEKDPANVV